MSTILNETRHAIDTIDNQIHDLLMERANLVGKVGDEKRQRNLPIVQPEREIQTLRRLLARHQGPLPREALVRMWRELVGAASLLQSGLKIVVTVPADGSSLIYLDLAKDYFSSVIPMQKVTNALAALALVRDGEATFAVLPRPADGEQNPWWQSLLDPLADRPLRIVARLPLGDRNVADHNPEFQGFVVARLEFQASGDDRSFIALSLSAMVSRARIVDQLKIDGITARSIYTSAGQGAAPTLHLVEANGYIAMDDPNLMASLLKLDPGGRAVVVGGYPTPPIYNDQVGKNAVLSGHKSS